MFEVSGDKECRNETSGRSDQRRLREELTCWKMLNCPGTIDVTTVGKCAEKVKRQWQDQVKEM